MNSRTGRQAAVASRSSGHSRTTSAKAASASRTGMSIARRSENNACRLKVMPMVATRIKSAAPNCVDARLDHQLRMHEHAGHQREQRDADLQRAIERRVERRIGDLGGDRGDQRGRRRELAPDAEEEREEVHHPRIDADLDHRRRDHDRDQDIGRRRRQAGAEQRAENEGQHHHGGEVDAGQPRSGSRRAWSARR